MELIRKNSLFEDVCVFDRYSLDNDYGNNKDFLLVLPEDTVLNNGDYIYSYNTEIGGKVTETLMDSNQHTITYKGLSWRGILDSIIIPVNRSAKFSNIFTALKTTLKNYLNIEYIVFESGESWNEIMQDEEIANTENNINANESLFNVLENLRWRTNYTYQIAIRESDILIRWDVLEALDLDEIDDNFVQKKYSEKIRYNYIVCRDKADFPNKMSVVAYIVDRDGVEKYAVRCYNNQFIHYGIEQFTEYECKYKGIQMVIYSFEGDTKDDVDLSKVVFDSDMEQRHLAGLKEQALKKFEELTAEYNNQTEEIILKTLSPDAIDVFSLTVGRTVSYTGKKLNASRRITKKIGNIIVKAKKQGAYNMLAYEITELEDI